MDRLVALLNEFEKERKSGFTWRSIDSYDNCVYGVDCDGETEITMYSDLYSKYYGFIKWLVDNEKVDFRKLDYKKFSVDIPTRYYLGTYIRYSFENEILMALSIQDNPIEFLISILK